MNAMQAKVVVAIPEAVVDKKGVLFSSQFFKAEGYLQAISGPEIKVLVGALEKIETIGNNAEAMQGIASTALAKFKEMTEK